MLMPLTFAMSMPMPCLLPGPVREWPLRFRETLLAAIRIAVPGDPISISWISTYEPDSVIVVALVTGCTPGPSWTNAAAGDKKPTEDTKNPGKVTGVAKLRIVPRLEIFCDSSLDIGLCAEIVFWMS